MKNYMKIILGCLTLVLVAIVLAQIGEAESGGVVYAMAIANYVKACSKNVGGNARVFIAEMANVTSVSVTSGEIDGITMATGKFFEEVDADIDSVIRTEVAEGRRTNISYTHRVEMRFAKPVTALSTFRDSLAAASPCGIAAIVQDSNGESWLAGYNETDTTSRGLFLVQDDTNSGAVPNEEDGNIVTVALETLSGYLDLPFDATEKAAIIADSATYIDYN